MTIGLRRYRLSRNYSGQAVTTELNGTKKSDARAPDFVIFTRCLIRSSAQALAAAVDSDSSSACAQELDPAQSLVSKGPADSARPYEDSGRAQRLALSDQAAAAVMAVASAAWSLVCSVSSVGLP